jgi:hypothetical protein
VFETIHCVVKPDAPVNPEAVIVLVTPAQTLAAPVKAAIGAFGVAEHATGGNCDNTTSSKLM